MRRYNYMVDPKEAGFELGAGGSPTSQGWSVVTPRSWHFRNKQITDKIQTVEGYSDLSYYMDCAKALIIVDLYEESPWKPLTRQAQRYLKGILKFKISKSGLMRFL
jgi:hypothetical protein